MVAGNGFNFSEHQLAAFLAGLDALVVEVDIEEKEFLGELSDQWKQWTTISFIVER